MKKFKKSLKQTNGALRKPNLKRKAPPVEEDAEEKEEGEERIEPQERDKNDLAEQSNDGNTFSEGKFHDLGLAEPVAEHLHGRMGFQAPTHIQREAIPVALSGRDVLVNAGAGTGKTLVYLVPMINALQGARKRVNRTDGTYGVLSCRNLVHRFIWYLALDFEKDIQSKRLSTKPPVCK
ncbi:hypothetical protein R1flu_018366 [Riccia fluitans]|uniref:DEAD-box RNA helicase Q domain-containing protein n=1 Tax=Riccia fluitans TaxID=41844 RepID=A0ABD1ZFU2_9MARC